MLDDNFRGKKIFVKFKYFKKLGDGCHFKWKGTCSKIRNNSDRSLEITVGFLTYL